MIISASRRTDIPAFYSDWFAKRVQDGYLLVRNPFDRRKVRRVSLLPGDVDAIVFWTRNAAKIINNFSLFDDVGLKYYFQYTVTGYPRRLEKSVPRPLDAIETFKKVSDLLGPERVLWRYDPILFSNFTEIDEHKRLFAKIASLLGRYTRRVTISFADIYKKTERNLKLIDGLEYEDILLKRPAVEELTKFMADVAGAEGLKIQTCSEAVDLMHLGVAHAKCIDDQLLYALFGISVGAEKDKGQREECGCIKSVDIGEYNTCLHGCAYCYATFNKQMAVKNSSQHDPHSPFLTGPAPREEEIRERQPSLL